MNKIELNQDEFEEMFPFVMTLQELRYMQIAHQESRKLAEQKDILDSVQSYLDRKEEEVEYMMQKIIEVLSDYYHEHYPEARSGVWSIRLMDASMVSE